MNATITIPDNGELVKKGNTNAIKDKVPKPRSWKEFCDNYPLQDDCFIRNNSTIESAKALGIVGDCRHVIEGVNWITSKKEAEAFLALMQLRQLRKAWVGEWRPNGNEKFYGGISNNVVTNKLEVKLFKDNTNILSFPTAKMTTEFLSCFKDLCETAKILL